jgi:hypothetical protein
MVYLKGMTKPKTIKIRLKKVDGQSCNGGPTGTYYTLVSMTNEVVIENYLYGIGRDIRVGDHLTEDESMKLNRVPRMEVTIS